MPEEDYGYILLTLQLPPAASLARTDAVARKIDQLLARTEGIANFNTIAGFSLLSRVTADNYGFYFIGLNQAWSWHIPLKDGKVLDWQQSTGSWRLWNYRPPA